MSTLALAATYSLHPSPQLFERLKDWSEDIEKNLVRKEAARLEKIAVGSLDASIDFLKEYFEEDLAEELVYLTKVTKPTAKRWMSGNNMNWRHAQKIKLTARIFYYLDHKQNYDKKESLSWYRSPQNKGRTPREMLAGYSYVTPSELRNLLQTIGMSQT
jgi:hypothetical protein